MKNTYKLLNLIRISIRGKKKHISYMCNKKTLKYLDLLVSTNALEYQKDLNKPNYYNISINYYNQSPVLKDLIYVGNYNKGRISKVLWCKEFNTKKSLYIIETNYGIKLSDKLNNLEIPKRLLFKVCLI